MSRVSATKGGFRARLRELYEGTSRTAVRFRYLLLLFDAAMILFIVVSSFFPGNAVTELLDIVFGVGVLAEFGARLWSSRSVRSELVSFTGVADLIVVASLLAPFVGETLAFLRVVRAFRVLRSYRLLQALRRDVPFFRRNENIVLASTHLALFVFVMTAVVYESQHHANPAISNYADALYFTVTTLTTTGFGDITMTDTAGRMLAVVIMILGVALFLRLIQTIFRPQKVNFPCPECGLKRHDPDAVHCKHCGLVLNIPNEGYE